MLVKILIGVAGVLVLFAAVVATRPSAYHVERKLEIAAPADVVFGALNDLHQFAGFMFLFGSPLEKADSNMQKTFEGPAAGVGQSFAWNGKEAGTGRLTIEESVLLASGWASSSCSRSPWRPRQPMRSPWRVRRPARS